jgi:putative oxidoreductase
MNRTLPLIFRLVLGSVFIWAGTIKVLGPIDFLVSTYGYQTHLPETLLRLAVVTLPWVEILCGLAILTGVWLEAGLILSAGMLAVFIPLTGQAWLRGLDISCGCFGSMLEEESFLGSVQFAFFRNLVLMAIAGALLLQARKANL